jgi:outer membrane receptor protein involved in Fe transport
VPTVYGAPKFEQKVTEAASFITIITSDEIQKYGYRTFAYVLRSVPGFYVTDDQNYGYLATRGFMGPGSYNNRVLIQIDGHRLNENICDGAYVDTEFPLDIDLIDRIEVIRGPGSALDGTDAFFAVIDVITKRGADFKGAEVSADAGSLNTYRGRATYGMKSKGETDWLLSGTYYHTLGNKRLFYPEFPILRKRITVTRSMQMAVDLAARSVACNIAGCGWRRRMYPAISSCRRPGSVRYSTIPRPIHWTRANTSISATIASSPGIGNCWRDWPMTVINTTAST